MFKRNRIYLATLILTCAVPLAVQAGTTPHWVHYKLLQPTPKLPKNLVILPINIDVMEVTAGGVKEEVPEWSTKAANNIYNSLSSLIKNDASLKQVKLPKLSSKMSAGVDEHMALYNLVVNTASNTDLEHKVRRFDYSIGPGLTALRKKTGADAAVMVYGRDHISTGGRITQSVLSKIPIVNIFTGQDVSMGDSFVHVGIIDLKTGDLLWMNSEYRDDTTDLRDFDDADDMIKTTFEWYPGIEKYRKAYVN